MDLLQSILLGIVQGITEWLPVSSSGHLAILQNLLNLNVPVLFDILLHLGTILAVLVVFKDDLISILKSIARLDFKSEHGRLAVFIVIALVPTAIIGFAFKDLFESFFQNLDAVGIALVITGCFLFICERWPRNKELSVKESLLIGIAQGIAIIPGISRSGATIGTGLLAGVDKEKVARFSFLLSVPAIIGASIFDFSSIEISSVGIENAVVGIIVSTLVGYLAIKFLLKIIKKQKFHWFAVYCWIIGLVVFLLL